MPDISYQMQLLNGMNDVRNPNSAMGALDRLGSSIGNAWQGYQGRTDEQDAVKFFMDKDVSPQTIQEFSATHPQMPLVDVYKTAGTLATQKEAQSMKDMTKTLQNAIAKGAQLDEKLLPTLFPNATPGQLQKFGTMLGAAQQAGLNFKSLKEKDRFKPIGAQGLYDTETKGIIGQPQEKTTPLQEAVKAKMLETNPETGVAYTAAEAYRLVAHPITPKSKLLTPEEEAQQIRIAQDKRPERLLTPEEEAQRVRISKAGRAEEKPDKPKRVPYRDTVTGAVNYYDVNNPKDRETLQKYGKQLQAVAENPMAPVIREAVTATPAKEYKTADDVRNDFKSGKIRQDEATKILREKFGYK